MATSLGSRLRRRSARIAVLRSISDQLLRYRLYRFDLHGADTAVPATTPCGRNFGVLPREETDPPPGRLHARRWTLRSTREPPQEARDRRRARARRVRRDAGRARPRSKPRSRCRRRRARRGSDLAARRAAPLAAGRARRDHARERDAQRPRLRAWAAVRTHPRALLRRGARADARAHPDDGGGDPRAARASP